MRFRVETLFLLIAALLPSRLLADDLVWKTSGPEGGGIRSLAATSSGPLRLYAGTGAGVFRSTDGGSSWSAANEGLGSDFGTISAIAVKPDEPSTVLVAGYYTGIFRSRNAGETWTRTGAGVGLIQSIRFDPRSPSIVYAAGLSDGGSPYFYVSSDAGATWSKSTSFLFGVFPSTTDTLAVDPSDGALYAGGAGCALPGGGCLTRSSDGGKSWEVLAPTVIAGEVVDVRLDPFNPRVLLASVWGKGVYRSSDRGVSWTLLSGLPTKWVIALLPDPSRRDNVFASTLQGQIFQSRDGGLTWLSVLDDPSLTGIGDILLQPGGGAMFAGAGAGVLKSSDGAENWSLANTGLRTNLEVLSVRIDPTDRRHLYAAARGGVFQSFDGGSSWQRTSSGLTNVTVYAIEIDPSDSKTVVAGTVGGVFRSQDAGRTWTASPHFPSPNNVYALLFDTGNTGVVLAGTDVGLMRSVDGGSSWTKTGFNGRVSSIAADPRANGVLYLASLQIYRSADHGVTWTLASNGTGRDLFGLSAFAIDPENPNTIYAVAFDYFSSTFSHLYRTDDGASTWRMVSTGLPVARFGGVVLDPMAPGRVYVGVAGIGVFRSGNGGKTWSPLGSALDASRLNALAIDPPGSTLYAATAGVFSLDLANLRAPVGSDHPAGVPRALPPRR